MPTILTLITGMFGNKNRSAADAESAPAPIAGTLQKLRAEAEVAEDAARADLDDEEKRKFADRLNEAAVCLESAQTVCALDAAQPLYLPLNVEAETTGLVAPNLRFR